MSKNTVKMVTAITTTTITNIISHFRLMVPSWTVLSFLLRGYHSAGNGFAPLALKSLKNRGYLSRKEFASRRSKFFL